MHTVETSAEMDELEVFQRVKGWLVSMVPLASASRLSRLLSMLLKSIFFHSIFIYLFIISHVANPFFIARMYSKDIYIYIYIYIYNIYIYIYMPL